MRRRHLAVVVLVAASVCWSAGLSAQEPPPPTPEQTPTTEPATAGEPSPPAGGATGPSSPPALFLAPVVLSRSDLPALARAELATVASDVAAMVTTGVVGAHWADIGARIAEILSPD